MGHPLDDKFEVGDRVRKARNIRSAVELGTVFTIQNVGNYRDMLDGMRYAGGRVDGNNVGVWFDELEHADTPDVTITLSSIADVLKNKDGRMVGDVLEDIQSLVEEAGIEIDEPDPVYTLTGPGEDGYYFLSRDNERTLCSPGELYNMFEAAAGGDFL